MKKRNKRKQPTNPRNVSVPPEPPKKRRLWRVGLVLAGVASAVVAGMALRSTSVKRDASPAFVPRPPGTVTFAKGRLVMGPAQRGRSGKTGERPFREPGAGRR